MHQTVPPYNLPLKRTSLDVFICMLVVSMLLHIAMSVFILVPARNMVQGSQPIYVDLESMPSPPRQESSPAAAEPEPSAEPEPLPLESPAETPTQAEELEKSVNSTRQEAAGKPEVVHRSSIGLGMTSGYFGSFAEGETLRPEIREYYFALMRRLNEAWWTQSESNPSIGAASFILVVNREGKVVACQPLKSSGNPHNDQMLIDAVKRAEPLPPLPESYSDHTFNTPIRFIPPLNLMLPGFLRKPGSPRL